MAKIQIAGTTDVGLVRQNNEDNFTVCTDLTNPDWEVIETSQSIELGAYGSLLVVADGMGGANAGEVASAITINTVRQMFVPAEVAEIVKDSAAIIPFMEKVINTANHNITAHSKENASTHGMGTTIVMAWIIGRKVYVGWCGDSRCYIFNSSVGFSRLSKDHSYVQTLIDDGTLTPELAFDHPMSNIITRCLSDNDNNGVPDFCIRELKDGDIIMLCSDGLCGYCKDDQISEIVFSNTQNIIECRNKLISAALAAGGYDNVTVAMARVDISEDEIPSDDIGNTLDSRPRKRFPKKFFLLLTIFFLCVAAVWGCCNFISLIH